MLYVTAELFTRFPLGVIVVIRHKYRAFKQFHSQYVYFNIACATCFILHIQWLVFRIILLSGDVETNPGPETLDFCCWNLNSIAGHDFLRLSLIEAYNSVFNYDLIGIVETHLENTVDKDRLKFDGYSFITANHPQNGKERVLGFSSKTNFRRKPALT